MIILLAFAFIAGLATVLSPCVLPVLPALLAVGTLKGKRRPSGVIIGLLGSFTFFTLTLTAIVQATGISANLLRDISIVIILLFGIVMIFPFLSNWFAKFTAPAAETGSSLESASRGSGFISGLILGAALGLLWTPCAGPILAAITALVATHQVSIGAVSMLFAYSLGAAIPLFIIVYGGHHVVQSTKFLSKHAEGTRQLFGCIMVATAIAMAYHWDEYIQQKITDAIPPLVVEDNPLVQDELARLSGTIPPIQPGNTIRLSDFGKAPDFAGIAHWINSPPLTMQDLRGKVVLIDFWTYSCINCLRTLPYIEKWYADYKDKGFVVVGVHTPEFEFEKETKNVEAAVKRLGIEYPVAQDNNYGTWYAYQNHYWPAHYLIDQNGRIRYVHFGEGGYVETENAIRELLNMATVNKPEPVPSHRPISPETYLGLLRVEGSYTSEITPRFNQILSYNYKTPLGKYQVGLKGPWKVEHEQIIAEGDDSYLDLNFLGRQVYLVLSGKSGVPLKVTLDGKPAGEITIDADRKYDIVSTTYGEHIVSIEVPKGISAYAFTFGDEDL